MPPAFGRDSCRDETCAILKDGRIDSIGSALSFVSARHSSGIDRIGIAEGGRLIVPTRGILRGGACGQRVSDTNLRAFNRIYLQALEPCLPHCAHSSRRRAGNREARLTPHITHLTLLLRRLKDRTSPTAGRGHRAPGFSHTIWIPLQASTSVRCPTSFQPSGDRDGKGSGERRYVFHRPL